MTATDRLLTPDEALSIIRREIRQRLPTESVHLIDAGGRVLAESLVADRDLPPFPASTMDGFAVIASDVSPWREIIADQYAGNVVDVEITPGTAARIMTGAPVPRGADAVVPVERTELRDDHVVILDDDIDSGAYIRPIGSDLRKGDELIPAGVAIGPAEIGVLASLGHARVTVYRRPRVSVLSTGDELVEPDQEPGPGQIRDSNRFSLVTAALRAGAEVVYSGHSGDDERSLRKLVSDLIRHSDVVITSGGVSVGEKDLLKAIFAELGTVHFQRLFMKPGKPLNFVTAGDTLIFGLPGNPVSALVGFEVFVRSAFHWLTGRPARLANPSRVTLSHDIQSSDRLEFQRAIVWSDDQGRLFARDTGPQQSARLMSLVGANAFILIAPRDSPYQAGEQVDAVILEPIAGAAAQQ
jgi:gephyrin